MDFNHRFLQLMKDLKRARSFSNRTTCSLIVEMLRLRFGLGRLGSSEYFDFRLYENDISPDDKLMFIGRRGQEILYETVCDELSTFLGYDKLTQYHIFTGLGLPTPALQALYAPDPSRSCSGIISIRNGQQLGQFLSESAKYPLYIKRRHGNYGRGNASILDFSGGRLALAGGEVVGISDFIERLVDHSGLGWLIQSKLEPHPRIRDVCGDQISGLRIYTMQTSSGPIIHRAVWKINTSGRVSDNFVHGASGNMLGAVDLNSGLVKRVVSGVGFNQVEPVVHSPSRESLVGFEIPDWQQAKELVLAATPAFPGFVAQGWDVALTDAGAVLLEMNIGGDVDLTQHVHRKGFLDKEYFSSLEELGIAHLLRGPSLKWLSYHGGARRGRRSQHWKWW